VHASVGEVEILKVGKITELRRHHTVERIPAEIEMLQVSQREQRSWYLAFKKCSTRALEYWVIVGGRASTKDAIIIRIAQIAGGSRGSEIEPDHMAGDVAAPDPSPAAAVMVLFPPRRQPACGIACDGSLERQQRVPLARYAARLLFVWLGRWCGALARATRKKLQPAAEAISSSSINSLFGYFSNEPARSI